MTSRSGSNKGPVGPSNRSLQVFFLTHLTHALDHPPDDLALRLAVTSLCLFGSAGRFDGSNAWILLGLNLCTSQTTTVLLCRNPELLAERRNARAAKNWDKPIVFIVVLLGPVATWNTAGLDIRFH